MATMENNPNIDNELIRLTDFKPIAKLELPNLPALDCSGLTVIVGPNSSGKSQLLRDIKERISGEPRTLVVATELEVATPDHQAFLRCLKAEGHIYSLWDDNDQEQYIPTTTYLGTGQGSQNVGSQQLEQWRTRSSQSVSRKRKNEYFGWLSRFLVTALFLENRLTSLTTVNTIDFEKQPPTHDLHALHLNDLARKELSAEVNRAFSKAIWSDISRGNQLCLRISEEGSIPDAETRRSVRKMSEYRTIESEGDGMKSYVATAISVLLGRRPVSVIDEPEMCLHPPQAYSLGQFLGRKGTATETATFVATHSSQVLRGIVQTAEKLQIVRLTRNAGRFSAKLVDSHVLKEAMQKPTIRAETVLDGIFSQAVAIVEADGDRIVYQAAWEVAGGDRNFDIHFATVGGTGGIADTCQLYRILGIPVAVIADLDLVVDLEKLKRVLGSLVENQSKVREMYAEARSISEEIRKLPPTVSEDETASILSRLAGQSYRWDQGEDRQLRGELSQLSGSLNRMRRLKSGGAIALPEPLSTKLLEFIAHCQAEGLFLVPVGELEEWLAGRNINASKKKKWAWANEAAQYIHSHPEEDQDIWLFVQQLGDFLTDRF